MNETMTAVTDAISNAGGTILYPVLLDQIGAQYRRNLPAALQKLQAAGTITQRVGRNAESGAMEHSIILVEGGI